MTGHRSVHGVSAIVAASLTNVRYGGDKGCRTGTREKSNLKTRSEGSLGNQYNLVLEGW